MNAQSPIPLAGDGSGRFLPWLIGLMAFLAVLATVAAFAIAGALDRWDSGLRGTLTVELPQPESGTLGADRIDAALALLRGTPGVATAVALDDAATTKLVEPWLGNEATPAQLRLPVLVDVRLAAGSDPDRAALETKLGAIVPAATVERRGIWLDHLFQAARLIEAAAAAMVLLVAAVAVTAVIFTTRTGLALHAEIISLLHLVGATDRYVARQFQLHAFRLVIGGGVIGLVMAFLVLGALRMAIESGLVAGGADLAAGFHLPVAGWLVAASLPLVMALVGLATARITVLRTLARMP